MKVDLSIFKDYDIRGIYPNQINSEIASLIAHAIVAKFHPKTIAIGRDMRLSGQEIRDAFVETFINLGVNVTDLGLVGTEIQYFTAGTYDFDMVLMISASHNPAKYNGLKLVKKGPIAITSESGLFDIRDLLFQKKLPKVKTPGKLTFLTVFDKWREKILSLIDIKILKPLTV